MDNIAPIITDPSDCDVYKWSMGNFLYKQGYLRQRVGWQFFSRGDVRFPPGYGAALQKQVDMWKNLKFTDDILQYFEKALHWLDYYYIWAYLKTYTFDTECIQIGVKSHGDYEEISVSYEEEWGKVIFFEIFLLSTMTELYHKMVPLASVVLSDEEQARRTSLKIKKIADSGAKVLEFGTRRRYSKAVQEKVIRQMMTETPEMLIGTSNAMFARKYNLPPVGTLGHELVMFMGAKYGPAVADQILMKKWVEVYNGALGIYLPDTYTTQHFLRVFDLLHSKLWDGVREDSALDTDAFVDMIIAHYRQNGIDPATKTVVHSNSIRSVESLVHMQNYRASEIKRSFGLGTWLTNDVYREGSGVSPMDWVIKMTHLYEYGQKRYCVKISDMPDKATSADHDAIVRYLRELGI